MSVTGQVGHVSFAKQTTVGTANQTTTQYKSVKITGDSLVAANNPITAEGEIGTGRDVTQSVPGGFSSAGAINGNLRVRAASLMLQGALGYRTEVAGVAGPPATVNRDEFTPANDLPSWTIEKKIGSGSVANELLILQYSDAMVNTLNLTCPTGGLATFSAGIIAANEKRLAPVTGAGTDAATGYVPLNTDGTPTNYQATSDDLLVFHGGRIRHGDNQSSSTAAATGLTTANNDPVFQSLEVVINNNIAADEYTIRPSRFLRSLTEGIRAIEVNMTIVFEDFAKYQKYTYGATANNTPGYSLYMGALEFFLGNWQIAAADESPAAPALDGAIALAAPVGVPLNPQAVQVNIPKLAFTGLPVALASGRIAVSTTARALKPVGITSDIIKAIIRDRKSVV